MAEINFPLKAYDNKGGATFFGLEDHWSQAGDTLSATDKLKLDEREAVAQVEKIKQECCEYCSLTVECRSHVSVGTQGKGMGASVKVSARTSLTKTRFLSENPPCATRYGATIS